MNAEALFNLRCTTLHSGRESGLKIACDVLTDSDLCALAALAATLLRPFKDIRPVPRGGDAFAARLRLYANPLGGRLIVDDVLTTGASMHEVRRDSWQDAQGVVIFARGPVDPWIVPLFTLNEGAWSL